MTYTIEKVTTLIGARRYGDNDTNIGFILTDSRSLCFPEETLFFALKSERNDGHNYIPELYRRMHPKDCWGGWSYKSTLQSFGCG